tara:strand:+ start:409 stop:1893 length:1485 start_codon:yes stop_codon:yes gene_type:complete
MTKLSTQRQNKQAQQSTSGLDSAAISALNSASPVAVYDTLDSLPMTGLSIGNKALVGQKLYFSEGNGWYNVDLNTGFAPYWLTEPDATYEITDSVTPLLVTAKALDSDNPNLINQSIVTDSAQYMVDITTDSSVWTFTPKTKTEIGTAVAAGNLTDSNGDFIYTFKWSDGINFVSKAVTITYNTVATGIAYLGDRGFNAGGNGSTTNISYFNIPTGGAVADFGDMQGKFSQMGGVGDGARIVTMGGYDNNKSPPRSDQIQYWASATTGNALDFGNLTQVKEKTDGVVGDATRAVVGGGYGASNSVVNEMDYITIQTTGDAQDFGNLTQARDEIGNTNDATRGVFIQGEISGQVNTQDYITVQTTSNATSFGNATHSVYGCHSGICADETRGLYMGGITSGNSYAWDTIEYVVIQTTGSATDFGNMDNGRSNVQSCSDGITGVITGGFAYPTGPALDYMQKVTIQTAGNATDFGQTLASTSAHQRDGAGMSGNAA